MCFGGSFCSDNISNKKNADYTSSRLCIIAFAASHYIDSSTARLAALPICLFQTKYIALSLLCYKSEF